MKKIILLSIMSTGFALQTHAQGCVAVRSMGGMCTMDHADMAAEGASGSAKKWVMNINNRYFNSYKHFVGDVEQKHRVQAGTQVVNHNNTIDIALTRILSNRWSVSVDVPVISNTRSSLYEHGNTGRYTTTSFGIGDTRIWASYWLLDPAKSRKVNFQLGLGLKLATGNYRYTDRFYTATGSVVGPVDQSIQLGDGGTGLTTELNAYVSLSRTLSLYGNFYYLANPQETNGVSTARGGTPSATAIANASDVMSVPDQMMYRLGANLILNKWTLSAGVRHEAVPVHDIIGGSWGFRRPGFITSIEPGATLALKKFNLYAFVPIAVERNRTQSMADKIATARTGNYTIGDAAFADLAFNIGISFKL